MSLILAAAYLPEITEARGAPAADASLDTCGAPDLPSARAKARRLVQQIRHDLTRIEDQIRHAPFLHAVKSGTATPAQIAAIAAEEYSIVHSDLISFRQMARARSSAIHRIAGRP